MIIEGANLGKKDVEYKELSQWHFFSDERQDIIKKLEELYLKYLEDSKKMQITPFPQKEGRVELVPGMLNHRCSNSIESLRGISKHGILASEWFGELESEREGVFCAFVNRIHSLDRADQREKKMAEMFNLKTLKSPDNCIVLFFDNTNPIMQKLLHLDYFEYVSIKEQNPGKIGEIYTPEEIELLEQVIEPLSPRGKKFHTNGRIPYCDWSAIPGGIPSILVNGICLKTQTYSKEYIEELAQLFPNATIFNAELEIVYTPKREKSVEELGKETLEEQKDTPFLDKIETEQKGQEINQEESKENTQDN